MHYNIKRIRAHVCVCQKTGELLYQLYQSPVPLCAAKPHLYAAQVNLYATQAHLYDVQANLRAPPVRLLSDSPGQACKSVNGEKAPRRTGRHANRDKDQSNVSTYGKQPPDKDRGNRVGLVHVEMQMQQPGSLVISASTPCSMAVRSSDVALRYFSSITSTFVPCVWNGMTNSLGC